MKGASVKVLLFSYFLLQAAWVLKHFCELKFKNEQNLKTSLEMVRQCLCSDKELPVRVEAAVALQVLLVEQEKGKQQRDPAFCSLVC